MADEMLRRTAAFLSAYCYCNSGDTMIPPIPSFIKDAIKLLIDGEVMTADEIRRDALASYYVLIPDEYFPD